MPQITSNKVVLIVISLLVILASSMGIFVNDFYLHRMNEITTFEIAGQDIVSLIIGTLFLFVVIVPKKIKLYSVVITGFLIYTTYIYSYFAFGLINSRIYMIYILIMGLSFYSLLSILLAAKNEVAVTNPAYPGKTISIYLIVIVALVGIIDSKDVISNTLFSTKGINTQGSFYMLDLAFLFPGMVIAAILNIRGSFIGLLFSGAFLIKTIVLMPALILSDYLHYLNNGFFVDFSFDMIALVIMMSAIAVYCLYYRAVKKSL
jgi:hypothetical protein